MLGLSASKSGPCSARFATCGLISTKFAKSSTDLDLGWSCFDQIALVSIDVLLVSTNFVQVSHWPGRRDQICSIISMARAVAAVGGNFGGEPEKRDRVWGQFGAQHRIRYIGAWTSKILRCSTNGPLVHNHCPAPPCRPDPSDVKYSPRPLAGPRAAPAQRPAALRASGAQATRDRHERWG